MVDQADNQNTEAESVQPPGQQAEQAAVNSQDTIEQATDAVSAEAVAAEAVDAVAPETSAAEAVAVDAPAEAAEAAPSEPVVEKTPEELAAEAKHAATVLEAVLFSTDAPLTAAKLGGVTKLPVKVVKQAIADLNALYERDGRAFRIEAIAGGYQMLSQPEYHDAIARLLNIRNESKLSQASMETLAVIAYRQPVLRADIEVIRGVACGEVLRTLMERQMVKIVGRAEVLGRPMLYGTTKKFLEVFGLNTLEDLPRVEELRTGFQDKAKSAPASETTKTEGADVAAQPPAQADAQTAAPDAASLPQVSETAPLADGAEPPAEPQTAAETPVDPE